MSFELSSEIRRICYGMDDLRQCIPCWGTGKHSCDRFQNQDQVFTIHDRDQDHDIILKTRTCNMSSLLRSLSLLKSLEEHSIEVHNSRRPLSRLSITLTLTLTFDLIFIGGWGIVMDYPCAEFCDFSFNRFCFIVRTDRITHMTNYHECQY